MSKETLYIAEFLKQDDSPSEFVSYSLPLSKVTKLVDAKFRKDESYRKATIFIVSPEAEYYRGINILKLRQEAKGK